VHASFEGSSASYAYLRQQIQGIPIANAVANVAFNQDNKVVAFGSSFLKQSTLTMNSTKALLSPLAVPQLPSPNASSSLSDAIATAEKALGGEHTSDTHGVSTLQYFVQSDGTLALAHVFQVSNDSKGVWYEAFVDAHSGKLLSVTDYVAHATVILDSALSEYNIS
jgi:extracellular elastinolytic metalloproteinase